MTSQKFWFGICSAVEHIYWAYIWFSDWPTQSGLRTTVVKCWPDSGWVLVSLLSLENSRHSLPPKKAATLPEDVIFWNKMWALRHQAVSVFCFLLLNKCSDAITSLIPHSFNNYNNKWLEPDTQRWKPILLASTISWLVDIKLERRSSACSPFCGGRENYSAELLDRRCGSQNNSPCPQRWPPLNSCDCVTLPGKRGCADVIKLRDPETVRLLWIIQTNAMSSESGGRGGCVCVCVCVRERDRERERLIWRY